MKTNQLIAVLAVFMIIASCNNPKKDNNYAHVDTVVVNYEYPTDSTTINK